MRSYLTRRSFLSTSFALLCLLVPAALERSASAQQILEIYNDSLATYQPTGNTNIQGVRPLYLQRGVNLDGSLRSAPGLAIALQGNPFENVWNGHERQGDLRIDIGTYAPMDIDIALPAKGFSWVIGRTYNARQETSSPAAFDSNGYQGYNWFQISQPEILLFAGASADKDVLYLVYGADRYVEYQRTGISSDDFKGKNGAAGVFVFAANSTNPDTYTLTDQVGNQVVFFGFDGASGSAAGQLWKMSDPDGNVAYVGDSSTSSTAISNGYSSGKILTAFDTSDRRYTYTYTTLDSVSRLTRVKVETKSGGTWASPSGLATVAQVDYTFYVSTDTDIANGTSGDLKKVTISDTLDDQTLTKKKYYRYWKGSYNSSTNPGYPHALWYVFDFEGVRSFDWAGDATLDEDFLTASESSLKPYSSAYFEYDSSHRVRKSWMDGSCGCSGAPNGTFEYSFATVSYSNTSSYQSAPAFRTVTKKPDASYQTNYFDETGQGLSQVITNTDPASSPTATWVTRVVRDSTGAVTQISTPANMDTYTHSTGVIVALTSAGLINAFDRQSSGNMTGFLIAKQHLKGSSDTPKYDEGLTWTSFTKTVGSQTLVRPLVDAHRLYHTEGTASGSNYNETAFGYVAYGSPAQLSIETKATTHPTVTTGNNGSNSATSRSAHFKKDGTVDFEKDEDGYITYHVVTNGVEMTTTQDADTTSLSPPTGFSHSGTPLNLTTTRTYTVNGRLQQASPPENVNKTYRTKLADERLVVLEYADFVAGSPDTFYGPVQYTVFNQANKVEAKGRIALPSNLTTSAATAHIDETKSDPVQAVATGTLAQLTASVYAEGGRRLNAQRQYFAIPGSLPGSDGTHYDATLYGYDDSGRQTRAKETNGTIRRTVYDAIGRTIEHWIGTNDYSFAGGEASGPDNMVKTDFVGYDGGSPGGNSLMTSRTLRVEGNSTGERTSTYSHDVLGRSILEVNPVAPHYFNKYDNLGRRIATARFSSTASISLPGDDPVTETANRLTLNETAFDQKGQVWKRTRHKIDDSDGSDDDTLATEYWYDAAGRVIKVDGVQLKKNKYDRIGRMTDEYILAVDDDSAYSDADDASGDIVLEEHQTRYHATDGTVIQRATISRFHADYGGGERTGKLDTNADNDDMTLTAANIGGRPQIKVYYFDRTERPVEEVRYGTYGGSTFTRPGSVDARSSTVLRTSTAYNTDGTVATITDPKAYVTKFEYDAEGRKTKGIRAYDAGVNSGSPSGTDDNVTTKWAYVDGLLVTLTADLPSGQTDQVTTYTFGTTKGASAGDSKIATGHLLQKITYPDSSGAGDDVTFAYNAQGQQIWKKDQAGNVLENNFDLSGRETVKKATTIISGFDNAVQRIATTYDALGRRQLVTQYDAASSGSVTDEVKYTYEDWGNVETFEQDKNSAVAGGGDHYVVDYTWAKATTGRNTIRKSGMTMPGGRAITYVCRSTGGLHDDEASRVTTVVDGGSVTLCQYDYNGLAQVVRTKYHESGVMSQQYSSTPGDYPDLDRFGRVIRSRWTKDLTTDVDFYRVDLTYDENANITSSDNLVHAGLDVKYSVDKLDRLTRAEEGTLASGSISSRTRDEQWTLSHAGNWDYDKVDFNGDGDFIDTDEMNDHRAHNDANELVARDTDNNGSSNYAPSFDLVGNTIDDARALKYEYDVFGRTRKLKRTNNSSLVAEYRYNGLGHRIAQHLDTDSDGDVDSNDKWFYIAYDERWRELARFRENDTSPKQDIVPQQAGLGGTGYSSFMDLIICRNRDADTAWTATSDGVLEERLYYCQNHHADICGLVSAAGLYEEGVHYSAKGGPYGIPSGDVDSSFATDSADTTQIQTWINTAAYDVRGDVDLDGDVDATDKSTAQSLFVGTTMGRGVLTQAAVSNVLGMTGAVYVLPANTIQSLRKRLILIDIGRFATRDPIGYTSSLNLFLYVDGRPLVMKDPFGLCGTWSSGNNLGNPFPGNQCWNAPPPGGGKLTVWNPPGDGNGYLNVGGGLGNGNENTMTGCGNACEPCTFKFRIRGDIEPNGVPNDGNFNNPWHADGITWEIGNLQVDPGAGLHVGWVGGQADPMASANGATVESSVACGGNASFDMSASGAPGSVEANIQLSCTDCHAGSEPTTDTPTPAEDPPSTDGGASVFGSGGTSGGSGSGGTGGGGG